MSIYVPKEIVLNNLEIPEGVSILYSTWTIRDEANTIVHYTDMDEVNLTSKIFTDVFEVGKKYYVTMSMVRTDGPTIDTRPLEVQVFSGEDTYNLYPMPSVIDTPVITMTYALDNVPTNDIKFTGSAMIVAGNATHDYSHWWLTNDTNEVIWDSPRDQINKTEIIVSDVDLKRDRFYTMHCVYAGTNRDTSGTGSITFRPSAFDGLELVGDLNNTYYGYSVETRLKDLNSDMTLFEYKLLGNDTELYSTSNTTGIVDLSSIILVDTYDYYILRLRLTTNSSVVGWKDIKFRPRKFIVDSDTWNDLDFQYENRIEVLDGKILNYDKSDYNISFTTPNGKSYQLPNGEVILLRTKTKIGRFSIDEDNGILTHLGDLYLPQVTLNKDYNVFNFKIFSTGDVLIGVGYTDYKLYRFKYDPVNNSFKYITSYTLANGGTNVYSEMHLVGSKVLFTSDGVINGSTQNLYSIDLPNNIIELLSSDIVSSTVNGNLVRLDEDDLLLRGGVDKLNKGSIINTGKLIHSTAGVISNSVDSRISLSPVGVSDESALQATLRNNELILGNFNRFKLKSNSRDEIRLVGSDLGAVTNKYVGGVEGSNGMIYYAPYNESRVLMLNPNTGVTTLIGPDLGAVNGKYYMGIQVNDIIYYAPHSASKVLMIDTSTNTVSLISIDLGAGVYKYMKPILAPNGMIYCPPNVYDHVLMINPTNNVVSLVGSNLGTVYGMYFDGIIDKFGNIYCAPLNSTQVLKINTATNVTTLIGPDLGAVSGKYTFGVQASNDIIYYAPSSASKVLKIDPNTDTLSLVGTDLGAVTNKYEDIMVGSNKIIYCIPNKATKILMVDPNIDITTLIGPDLGTMDGKYSSCLKSINNKIYLTPSNYSKILELDPSGLDAVTFNLKKLPADKNTMVDTTPFIFKSNGGEDFKFTIFLNNGKRIFMSYSKDKPKMILYK